MDDRDRVRVEPMQNGFTRIVAHYGFMEAPDVIAMLARDDTPTPAIEQTTFFLGSEIVLPEGHGGMARWRARLFWYLSRNAARPTAFFNIPPHRVVELGSQITV